MHGPQPQVLDHHSAHHSLGRHLPLHTYIPGSMYETFSRHHKHDLDLARNRLFIPLNIAADGFSQHGHTLGDTLTSLLRLVR
jgi:hypothetical protein